MKKGRRLLKMKLQEAIDKRHSIREFEQKRVPKKIIQELIKNATKAPNAGNRQPWTFYCVDNGSKMKKISELLFKQFKRLWKQTSKKSKKSQKISNNFYQNIGNAQNLIFVYRKKEINEPIYIKPNDIASIACAMENLMLCAVEKGLGTCWIGTFNGNKTQKELRKILKIKENEELVGSLVIGYPKRSYKPLIRKKKKLNEILKFI